RSGPSGRASTVVGFALAISPRERGAAMSKEGISGVLARENRALLENLGQFERALTRNSIDSMKEIVRAFESQLSLHLRGQEEAFFPVLSRHLRGRGEPVTRRRVEGREHEGRVKELRTHLEAGRWGKFLHEGRVFVAFLREYLVAGDDVLLPLARRVLSPEEWNVVRRGYESIGSSHA
ncbi:MAG TPA: hemerythrin domain-containing protein, partial [Planctomycetota bacterium]|nr:hemerythrin domain-containing protein [Planctomycetota bacterium]